MKGHQVISLLIFLSSTLGFGSPVRAKSLDSFVGTWAIKSPERYNGETVTFIRKDITLKAAMPNPYGQVSITGVAQAIQNADFVMAGDINGESYSCYYALTVFADSTMSWVLQGSSSSDVCRRLGNVNWMRSPPPFGGSEDDSRGAAGSGATGRGATGRGGEIIGREIIGGESSGQEINGSESSIIHLKCSVTEKEFTAAGRVPRGERGSEISKTESIKIDLLSNKWSIIGQHKEGSIALLLDDEFVLEKSASDSRVTDFRINRISGEYERSSAAKFYKDSEFSHSTYVLWKHNNAKGKCKVVPRQSRQF